MLHIDQAVIVEGKYDKIKLSTLLDTTIITTDGFGIFNQKEKAALIRMIGQKHGLIVLTDSDGGGRVIRSFLRNLCAGIPVTHLYIPRVKGKEKRKSNPSKEGFLGVEGMSVELLTSLFERAGIIYTDKNSTTKAPFMTKALLYADGLSGAVGATERRRALCETLALPPDLSSAALVESINLLFTPFEYEEAVKKIYEEKIGV